MSEKNDKDFGPAVRREIEHDEVDLDPITLPDGMRANKHSDRIRKSEDSIHGLTVEQLRFQTSVFTCFSDIRTELAEAKKQRKSNLHAIAAIVTGASVILAPVISALIHYLSSK